MFPPPPPMNSLSKPAGGGGGKETYDVFQPVTSVQVRWPQLSDAERLDRALELYAINSNASVPWYDESQNPCLKPHPDDFRPHEQHIRKLERKCLKYGIRPEIRGQPWALMSENNRPPYLLISWGSLTRAAYRAAQAHPDNQLLKKSMQRPLNGVQGSVVEGADNRSFDIGYLILLTTLTVYVSLHSVSKHVVTVNGDEHIYLSYLHGCYNQETLFINAIFIERLSESENPCFQRHTQTSSIHKLYESKVVLFHAKTPQDVTNFLRDFHNKWNDALGKSFLSIILESRQHNLSWLAHAKLKKLSATNCGKGENSFAARCWTYVCPPWSHWVGPW